MKVADKIAMERAEWCVAKCLHDWYERGQKQTDDPYWRWESDPSVIGAFEYIRAALETCPDEYHEELEQMHAVLLFIRNKAAREFPDPDKSVRAVSGGLPGLGRR